MMFKARTSTMKFLILSSLCLAAAASVLLAQEPAPNPPGPGGAPAPGATDKPKPLSSGDKAALKKMTDTIFFETNLTDKHKNDNAKIEETKKVAGKMNTDLNKIWGELAGLLDPKEIPTELSGGDKSKAQRISKAGDKYDKELLDVLEKETKQLEKAFDSASKSTQTHPTIKEVATKWLPTVREHGEAIAKAAKEAGKQK